MEQKKREYLPAVLPAFLPVIVGGHKIPKIGSMAFPSHLTSSGSLLHASMKDIFSVYYFLLAIFLTVIPQQFKTSCLLGFSSDFFSALKQAGKHLCQLIAGECPHVVGAKAFFRKQGENQWVARHSEFRSYPYMMEVPRLMSLRSPTGRTHTLCLYCVCAF